MKNIIRGFVVAVIMVLFFIIITINNSYTIREKEAQDALDRAIYNVLDEVQMQGKLNAGSSNEEIVSEFTALLSTQLNVKNDKNFSLTIDIYGVDNEKGLLSLKVTEHFTYPNGKVGSISSDATMILEQEAPKKVYTITYLYDYADDNYDTNIRTETWKEFQIQETDALKVPENPPTFNFNAKQYSFDHWVDENGHTVTKAEILSTENTKDRTYKAIYKAVDTIIIKYRIDGHDLKTTEIIKGSEAVSQAPFLAGDTNAKPGWIFVGWRSDTKADPNVYTTVYPSVNSTYYAVFKRAISLTAVNDSQILKNEGIQYYNLGNYLDPFVTITNNSTKSGWNLLGYREDKETIATISYVANNSYQIHQTTNIYALFSQNLTVSYAGNGATSGAIGNTNVTRYYNNGKYNDPTISLPNCGFARTYHRFVGYTLTSGSATHTGGTAGQPGATYQITTNCQFRCEWQATEIPAAQRHWHASGKLSDASGNNSGPRTVTPPAGCTLCYIYVEDAWSTPGTGWGVGDQNGWCYLTAYSPNATVTLLPGECSTGSGVGVNKVYKVTNFSGSFTIYASNSPDTYDYQLGRAPSYCSHPHRAATTANFYYCYD